jgi:hypothetical protein
MGALAHALVAVHTGPRIAHVASVTNHHHVASRAIEMRSADVGSPDSKSLQNESASTDKSSPDTTSLDTSGDRSVSVDTNQSDSSTR